MRKCTFMIQEREEIDIQLDFPGNIQNEYADN
jgi:hypothetical protein